MYVFKNSLSNAELFCTLYSLLSINFKIFKYLLVSKRIPECLKMLKVAIAVGTTRWKNFHSVNLKMHGSLLQLNSPQGIKKIPFSYLFI